SDEELTAISEKLKELLPKKGQVLVAGLGNKDITPDALGPFVSDAILATRHIDAKTAESIGLGGIRSVCSFKTGVLGQTGIEASEMLLAISEKIKPSAIVVIDALAARNTNRIGSTVQISTSGICPGSGVFNKRAEISKNTLGIDVISIGIPTVVDANTIACDLLEESENETAQKLKEKEELFSPKGRMFMVTPKDIDLIIEKGAKLIALMINMALQETLSKDDIIYLTT
ncbi:MAG: GPR endopeptidase, partial [Oscillospiraceae bacterium]